MNDHDRTTQPTQPTMEAAPQLPDLRPMLTKAQARVAELIDGVTADQLDLPTPCPELTVRQLIGHLYAGAERVRVMAEGGDPMQVPFVHEPLGDDPAGQYRGYAAGSQRAWAGHARLDFTVRAPWGEVPAAAAVGSYLVEALAHGWDLAMATGQPADADPELAEQALAVAQRAIPAEPRGGRVPFGPVLPSASDATPTERLVNWLGRSSAAWAARAA